MDLENPTWKRNNGYRCKPEGRGLGLHFWIRSYLRPYLETQHFTNSLLKHAMRQCNFTHLVATVKPHFNFEYKVVIEQ